MHNGVFYKLQKYISARLMFRIGILGSRSGNGFLTPTAPDRSLWGSVWREGQMQKAHFPLTFKQTFRGHHLACAVLHGINAISLKDNILIENKAFGEWCTYMDKVHSCIHLVITQINWPTSRQNLSRQIYRVVVVRWTFRLTSSATNALVAAGRT